MITSGTQKQLPGSVNGALTPELIPDVVANRLFLKVQAGDDADKKQDE